MQAAAVDEDEDADEGVANLQSHQISLQGSAAGRGAAHRASSLFWSGVGVHGFVVASPRR